MNITNEIESVLDLYSILLKNKKELYNKRVGIFNNLVENFFSEIFESRNELIFEYRLKFANNLLIESVLPNKKNFDHKIIVEWISKKIEFGTITLKEQYSQEELDRRGYFYTREGKLVQGKKNAPNGIEAKYVYPDLYTSSVEDPLSVPKDPKGLPTQISSGAVDQGFKTSEASKYRQSSKEQLKQSASNITKTDFIQKYVAPKCKTTKDQNGKFVDYLGFNIPANALGNGSKAENNLRYLCHDNYCNNNRNAKYDPEKKLCKNNTVLSKIKEVGWEGFFEFLREQMNSVAGAATQVVLDVFGAGVGVQFAWFVLLCWDVSRPEKSWLNILVDIVGILTFGTGPSTLMTTLKTLYGGASLTGIAEQELVKLIVTHKKDLEWVLKLLPTFEGIFKLVVTLSEKIAVLFGGPGVEFLISSLNSFKNDLIRFIGLLTTETTAVAVEKGAEKLITKAGAEYVGKPVAQVSTGDYYSGYKDAQKVASKTSSVLGKIK